MEIVKQLDKSLLECGAIDRASSLFRMWRETGGMFPDSLARMSPHLLFNAFEEPENEPPRILFAGNETLVCKIHGSDYFSPAHGRKQIPNKEIKNVARAGYLNAMTGEPTYDFVFCEYPQIGADPLSLAYERLILPARTASFPYLVTLCTPTENVRIDGLRDPECPAHHSKLANCRATTALGSIST